MEHYVLDLFKYTPDYQKKYCDESEVSKPKIKTPVFTEEVTKVPVYIVEFGKKADKIEKLPIVIKKVSKPAKVKKLKRVKLPVKVKEKIKDVIIPVVKIEETFKILSAIKTKTSREIIASFYGETFKWTDGFIIPSNNIVSSKISEILNTVNFIDLTHFSVPFSITKKLQTA